MSGFAPIRAGTYLVPHSLDMSRRRRIESTTCSSARSSTRPGSVDEAVSLLSEHEGARVLAGGQTLVNVMKARAAAPDVLADLADLEELRAIGFSPTACSRSAQWLRTRKYRWAPRGRGQRPILAEVAATIADVQVRNRGTVGR